MNDINATFPIHLVPSQKTLSNGTNTNITYKLFITWSLFNKIYNQTLPLKTLSPPRLLPQCDDNRKKSFKYLWMWPLFFGWLIYNFTPKIATDVKHDYQTLYIFGIFSFSFRIHLFNLPNTFFLSFYWWIPIQTFLILQINLTRVFFQYFFTLASIKTTQIWTW